MSNNDAVKTMTDIECYNFFISGLHKLLSKGLLHFDKNMNLLYTPEDIYDCLTIEGECIAIYPEAGAILRITWTGLYKHVERG